MTSQLTLTGGGPSAGSNYVEKVLGYSPIAYWILNETSGATADNSEGTAARDGTYSNCSLAALAGPFGDNVASFGGANSYVNIQTASMAGAFNGSEGSMLAAIKVSAAGIWTDGANREIMRVLADGSNYVFLKKDNTNNQIEVQYRAGGTTEALVRAGVSSTDWLIYLVTWSKSNDRVRLYENGNGPVDSSTGLGIWAGSPTTSLIGVAITPNTNPWSGGICHCALFTSELDATAALDLSHNSHYTGLSIPVMFGESATAGSGASDVAHRWANVLADDRGWGYFINAGIAATVLQNTTQNTVATIGGAVDNNARDTYTTRVTAYQPNWVFILYGLNDIRLNDAAITVANYQNDLGEIVDGIIAAGTDATNIVIGSPHYMDPTAYGDFAPWNGGSTLKHQSYVAAAAAVASAKGTKYADIYQAMLDGGDDALIAADGIHPNDDGHALIASTFAAAM